MTREKSQVPPANAVRYNPALGPRPLVTPAVWCLIGPTVLECVAPVWHLAPPTLRRFQVAMVRFTAWANGLGYSMSPHTLLTPVMVRAYLASVAKGAPDDEPQLWRLSKSWGLTPHDTNVRDGIARPDYREPYSDDELEMLLLASRNQATAHRRVTLLAVIALGAGCGIVRQAAHDAKASDLHLHGDSAYFRASGYCAFVRPEFAELLSEVCAERPVGRLRGESAYEAGVTVAATEWLKRQHGVPRLAVDRLRATYVCALLSQGVAVIDVMTWCGLSGAESLDGYLAHVRRPALLCPLYSGSPS